MLEIKDLSAWLPQEVVSLYEGCGMKELYPPQEEAVSRGLLDGKNMMIAIPTAAGKTFLAELAMLRSALSNRRSLYIVPLRALANEKYDSFKRFKSLGVRVGISTGDFDRKDERLGKNHIIVATSEKADSLIRNDASWVRELGVLVADEIHLLNSANRGPTLEMTITKLAMLNPSLQVIGLSATVANGADIAAWLSAEYLTSEWRPIRLREGVICGGRMIFPDGESPLAGKDEMLALVRATLGEGGQILIFESSRRNAESAASKAAADLQKALRAEEKAKNKGGATADKADSPTDDSADPCKEIEKAILSVGESETARKLASCVLAGVAFHHAGLLHEQRKLIEEGFRRNAIKVVASTPTLAAGLNLPARRVLIKSYRRYEVGAGMIPIPVMEYRQMAGRAGRPGLDPFGESLLIAKNEGEFSELMDRYILGKPEEITSKLASESALRTHILSSISAGFVSSYDSLREFMGKTFYATQQDAWHLETTIERVLSFLEKNVMISSKGEEIEATRLGKLVSRLYIDPLSAAKIIEGLKQRPNPTDLTLLHIITTTPNMEKLYVQQADDWIEEFIDSHMREFVKEDNYDWLLQQAKTAALLLDWISEVKEEAIAERFRIGPGDIRRVSETGEWLMHSTKELSKHLELGSTFLAGRLEQRIHYGAGPDLLALLELKGIGRVRARKLHQHGYTSIEKLKAAPLNLLSEILGPKVAAGVNAQLKDHDFPGRTGSIGNARET